MLLNRIPNGCGLNDIIYVFVNSYSIKAEIEGYIQFIYDNLYC